MNSIPSRFNGIYRGLSPSFESGVEYGESKLQISDTYVVMKIATGVETCTIAIHHDDIRPLDKNEILDAVDPAIYGISIFGFIMTDELTLPDGALLFINTAELDGPSVAVFYCVSQPDQPAFYFSDDQVKRGLFEKAIAEIEEKGGPDSLPRLMPSMPSHLVQY